MNLQRLPAPRWQADRPCSALMPCAVPHHIRLLQTAALRSIVTGSHTVAASATLSQSPPCSDVSFPSTSAPHTKRRSSPIKQSRSLRQVPGVGPKNEALFNAKGLTTVDQLLTVYTQRHGADIARTKAFIQEEVGIRNKAHVSRIMDFLSSRHEQDGDAQQLPGSFGTQPKLTLSVEGNISAGKSTFLQILKESGIEQHLQVVPEPVDKWQNVGEGKVNLLMEFYQNPQRFAYTFQNYVFLTRMVQERESYSQSMCRLLERSIFSDRMVFVRAVHKSKFMNDTELAIYDSWFDPVLNTLPTLVPNGFIYLRAEPDTCYRRMQKRSRNEESKVQLDYLQDLHQHHEDWLWSGGAKATDSKYLYIPPTKQTLLNKRPSGLDPATSLPPAGAPLLSVRDPQALCYEVPEIPADLQDSLFILDTSKGSHMLPQLNQIPALVLDCNDDVDVERDETYRQHIANQVRQYTEYVRTFTKAKASAQFKLLEEPAFNGYYLRDSNGNILYTAPEWHALSHAEQRMQMERFEVTSNKVKELQASLRGAWSSQSSGGVLLAR